MPRQIGVRELAEWLKRGEDLVLLDVRQRWEHDTAHLPGSLLIPLQELADRIDEIDAGKRVVAYCHHGIRSLNAAAILEQAGFGEVVSLAGGIDAWSIQIDPRVPRY